MKITVLCEGKTEQAFKEHLNTFLKARLGDKMPRITWDRHDGAIPTGDKLKRVVRNLLSSGKPPSDAVIALTDVYPAFKNAANAKEQMQAWVGEEPRFHPHVALHDFEAWLLPHWQRIQELSKKKQQPFGKHPEEINTEKPPAHRLKQMFEAGKCRDSYNKPRDAARILRGADLMISVNACPELKSFINTILRLSGGQELP